MVRRIEDGRLGWTVNAIFDGHIFPMYGNYTTRLDRSRDRTLTHEAPPYELTLKISHIKIVSSVVMIVG